MLRGRSEVRRSISLFRANTSRNRGNGTSEAAFPAAIEMLEGRLMLSASPRLAYGPDTTVDIPPATAPLVTPAAQIATTAQPAHLVIDGTFDSSITNNANAATIEADLNTMMQNFESDISTPITVKVEFKADPTISLADSLTYSTQLSYPVYLKALTAHATSANDKTIVASLPVQTDNPVNGGANVLLTLANARALGFNVTPANGFDSILGFNIAEFNLSRFPGQINSSKYDLIASASHEMDEVLSISSALNAFNNKQPLPTTYVDAEDLFRYDLNTHKRSFNTNPNTVAYFSVDGGKDSSSVTFSQSGGGNDFNDWSGPVEGVIPEVQDAEGTPGATPNLGYELFIQDEMGYTLASGVIGGIKPDLVPAALAGWSSPLVLTTTKNAIVDSPTLPSTDTIYLDAAVMNRGEFTTLAAETNVITLDGKTVFTFNDPKGLTVNNAYLSIGLSLGMLSAGTHTISITADTGNTIPEIIESNNTFSRTFTVTAALPDLLPYTPPGWTSPLVVTTSSTGTTESSEITTADTVYVSFAYINNGAAPVTQSFDVVLKLNGTTAYTLDDTSEPYAVGEYGYDQSLNAGKEPAGTYTLEMIIDSTNTIAEGNESNNTFTQTFTVVAAPVAPAVTKQPMTQSVSTGTKVTLTAAASGTPAPTVQWQISTNAGKTYTNISGATSTTYSFTATVSQTGDYYRAVFTNSKGTATTTAAILTVTAPPVITKQPASLSVTNGAKVTLTVTATGSPTPTVQWQISTNAGKSYTNISGATSTTYSFTAVTAQTGDYYRAVLTNSKGTATTTAAILTVTAPPAITKQPVAQSVKPGAKVTFTATASGSPTPTVQWQLSTNAGKTYANISGATSTSYSLTVAAAENGYLYRAVFTNSKGSATTTAVKLTV